MASFLSSADHEEKIYYELTKSKQTNVAIYAVPYMGGDASCYGALAREFDNQNIGVKLMSTSIFDVGNEVDGVKLTIEEFARIRAREIVAQGEDNIFLLGHCGGTFMTIAIADELKAMNVKVKGIFLSGMVPMQEPNKILVEAEKRRTFRQFIAMLRGLGFTDRLNVTVAKRYRNAIIEMTEFRYRRNKKLKHKVFKHWTPVYSMVADRDPETFDHKRGYKRWKRFAHKVEHIVLESRSHYFISRSADDVTMEIDRIIKNTKSVSRGKGNGPNVDTEVVSETVIEKTN